LENLASKEKDEIETTFNKSLGTLHLVFDPNCKRSLKTASLQRIPAKHARRAFFFFLHRKRNHCQWK